MPVKLNSPVRLTTGEVTTIATLADSGLIKFTTGEHTGPKRNGERKRVRHFHAELTDGSGFWEISESAYRSRTGEDFKLPEPEPRKPRESGRVNGDTGIPWLNGNRA